MMTPRWPRRGLLAVAVLAVLAVIICVAAPAAFAQIPFPPAQQPAQPIPPPARDPRLDQVRQHLERQGLKVHDVRFQLEPRVRPRWIAITQANYAQPSFDRITQQAYMIWNALYAVLGDREPPTTLYTSVQVWNKYAIGQQVQVNHLATLVNALRAARTPQEQQQAHQAFYGTIEFYVIDAESGQFVDEKDFVNKNFAR